MLHHDPIERRVEWRGGEYAYVDALLVQKRLGTPIIPLNGVALLGMIVSSPRA
jgi:hypothetical protein